MAAEGSSEDAKESDEVDKKECHPVQVLVDGFPIYMLIFFISLLVVFFVIGPTAILKYMLSFLPKNPGAEHALVLGLIIVASIVLLLPFWPPLMIITAMVFGFWRGFCIIYIAMILGAAISFVIGRYFCKQSFREYIDKSDYVSVRRMIRVVEAEDNSFKFMFLFRFMFLPIWARNYAPSLVDVPFLHFIVPVCVHAVMICTIFAFTGEATKDFAQAVDGGGSFFDKMDPKQLTIFAVSLTATVSLSYLAYREYSRRLAEEDATPLLTSHA